MTGRSESCMASSRPDLISMWLDGAVIALTALIGCGMAWLLAVILGAAVGWIADLVHPRAGPIAFQAIAWAIGVALIPLVIGGVARAQSRRDVL